MLYGPNFMVHAAFKVKVRGIPGLAKEGAPGKSESSS